MTRPEAIAKAKRLQAKYPTTLVYVALVEEGEGSTWDAATETTFDEWDDQGYVVSSFIYGD